MIIKLTNAVEEFEDKTLLINTDHIITFYESNIDDKIVTNIFSTTQHNWQVKESIDTIYSIINN